MKINKTERNGKRGSLPPKQETWHKGHRMITEHEALGILFEPAENKVGTLDVAWNISMPMGTGKTTLAKWAASQGMRVIDVDTLREERGQYSKYDAQLKKLRRKAVKSGDWRAYNAVYDPLLKGAILEEVKENGPIGALLNHGDISRLNLRVGNSLTLLTRPLDHLSRLLLRSVEDVDADEGNSGMSGLEKALDVAELMTLGVSNLNHVIDRLSEVIRLDQSHGVSYLADHPDEFRGVLTHIIRNSPAEPASEEEEA